MGAPIGKTGKANVIPDYRKAVSRVTETAEMVGLKTTVARLAKRYTAQLVPICLAVNGQISWDEIINSLRPVPENSVINVVKSVARLVLYQLHWDGLISLDYCQLQYLTQSGDLHSRFLFSRTGFSLGTVKWTDADARLLKVMMLKNRLLRVTEITAPMLEEFQQCSEACGGRRDSKYSSQYTSTLHRSLFLAGIIEVQPDISHGGITDEDYFVAIPDNFIKQAIDHYLEFGKLKIHTKSGARAYLRHFACFICEELKIKSLSDFTQELAELYQFSLRTQLESGAIRSKNWCMLCVRRINAFLNFLYDDGFPGAPDSVNLLSPNQFDDKELKSTRSALSNEVCEQILLRAKGIGEFEYALMVIYAETGIRLNELTVLEVGNWGKDAREHGGDNNGIRDDIGWVKVTGPKILNMERIVHVPQDVIQALDFLLKYRSENFGDVQPMVHPAYQDLGRRNYLLLNSFGLPYASLVRLVTSVLDKISICDDDGKPIRATTHQFRHTCATKMIANGLPIHVVMDQLGHVDPSMAARYDHTEISAQDIIMHDNLIDPRNNITIEYDDEKISFAGRDVNRVYTISRRALKRGGYCTQNEFEEACNDIDCIECPKDNYSSNITFAVDIRNSMVRYLDYWQKETEKGSDRAVHYLYLAYLYELLLEKVSAAPNELCVRLNDMECRQIANRVGWSYE